MKVFKFPIQLEDAGRPFKMNVPAGTRFIHVNFDASGVPCIWGEVPDVNHWYERVAGVYYTGQTVSPSTPHYIGTLIGDALVYHVYSA